MTEAFTRAIVFLNPKNENPTCSHDAAALLRRLGIPDVQVVSLEAVHAALGRIPASEIHCALYVQPGGGDDVDVSFANYFKSNRKLKPAVEAFVAKGGAYLGICLGAYSAAAEHFDLVRDAEGDSFFQFDELDDDDAKILQIEVDGKRYGTYHQGGPDLSPMLLVGGAPFGTYVGLDAPVGVVVPYKNGRGTIGLLSPHFEANDDWDDAKNGRRADDCTEPAQKFLELLATVNQERHA